MPTQDPEPKIDYGEKEEKGTKIKKTREYKDKDGYMVFEDYSSYEDANSNHDISPRKEKNNISTKISSSIGDIAQEIVSEQSKNVKKLKSGLRDSNSQ